MPSGRRIALAALAVLAAAAPTTAQSPDPASAEALMTTVRTLAAPELGGRGTGSAGGLKARAWIEERFRALGLDAPGGSYLQAFTVGALEAANVIGRCRGTDPRAPVLVVSAHYDHVGTRGGAVYPGADDNASGVAALLALAAQCVRAPFRHTVIVAAFDAEEVRLSGARHFVRNPPVPLDRIALNINLDMVARGDKGELYAAGTSHSPSLRPLLEPVAESAPIRLRFGHDRPGDGADDWTMQSDHGAFHEAKIPFVYFGVEDHPDYHRPTDTPDRISSTFFGGAVRIILAAVRALDAGLAAAR